MIEIESAGGTIRFDGNTITIRRGSSRMARSVFGDTEHTIPVTRITAVEWKAPQWSSAGYLRFVVPGSQSSAEPTPPNRDENTILFGKRQRAAFEKLRDLVRDAISR